MVVAWRGGAVVVVVVVAGRGGGAVVVVVVAGRGGGAVVVVVVAGRGGGVVVVGAGIWKGWTPASGCNYIIENDGRISLVSGSSQ